MSCQRRDGNSDFVEFRSLQPPVSLSLAVTLFERGLHAHLFLAVISSVYFFFLGLFQCSLQIFTACMLSGSVSARQERRPNACLR